MTDESSSEKNVIRRRQILAATMKLVRQFGTDVTTAQIAAQASCSKETLYNWFGDRQGILKALIEEQGQGMGAALKVGFAEAEGRLEDRLATYCTHLLDIMTGDAVLVVNRLAMSQTCEQTSELGQAVLSNWQEQVAKPFEDLFLEGNQAGTLAVHSPQEAFDNLIGLLIGDRQRQLLLGTAGRPPASAMGSVARKAVQRWLILYRR